MVVAEIFRIDYPNWCEMDLPENQPLGIFVKFSNKALVGLRVVITNDAESVDIQLESRTSLLRPEPDYFGEPTVIGPTSPLYRLLGQRLLQIDLGQASDAKEIPLITAIKLVFEQDSLVFTNNCDEGLYIWSGEQECIDYFEKYQLVYEDFTWSKSDHWMQTLRASTLAS